MSETAGKQNVESSRLQVTGILQLVRPSLQNSRASRSTPFLVLVSVQLAAGKAGVARDKSQ